MLLMLIEVCLKLEKKCLFFIYMATGKILKYGGQPFQLHISTNPLIIWSQNQRMCLYTDFYTKTGQWKQKNSGLYPLSSLPSPSLCLLFSESICFRDKWPLLCRGWQPTQRWYWIDFRNVAELTVWCILLDMNHKNSIKKPLNGWHQNIICDD